MSLPDWAFAGSMPRKHRGLNVQDFLDSLSVRHLMMLIVGGVLAYGGFRAYEKYTTTPEDEFRSEASRELVREFVYPVRANTLPAGRNPGTYYGLPADVRPQVDAMIRRLASEGQEILCCEYEPDDLSHMCNGLKVWKDQMVIPLEDIIAVHPENELAYLGVESRPACPETQGEIWNIIGLHPGVGWNPSWLLHE